MIYPFSLSQALAVTGCLLIALGLFAFLQPARVQTFLRKFPRSESWGTGLMLAVGVWSWLLIRYIDLGEFDNWRGRILIFIPIATFLTLKYVREFLAVRAFGMLALLASEPLLEAAFLRPEWSRLFLVVFAYAWILAGMFWIGIPYLLRDQIAWLTQNPRRWQTASIAFAAYGGILLLALLERAS